MRPSKISYDKRAYDNQKLLIVRYIQIETQKKDNIMINENLYVIEKAVSWFWAESGCMSSGCDHYHLKRKQQNQNIT